MNPLTQFKKILILPILIALALVALASLVSATLPPGNTVAAVEQDRRGHSRGLGRVPSRGVHLHGLHLGCSL